MTIDYDEWHKKIEATLAWRQNYWNGDKAWKRYLALYRGDHWRTSRYNEGFLNPDSDVPRDRITVNYAGSTITLAKSFLIKNSPKFILKPRPKLTDTDVQIETLRAMVKQEVLNYEYEQQDMHIQNKEAVLDCLIMGHGIVKNGFTDKKPISKKGKKDAGVLNTKEYITDGSSYIERINPFRFLFDIENESFRQLDNVAWCAEIIFKNINDVLENDRYNSKVIGAIKRGEEKPDTYKSNLHSSSEYQYNKGDAIETDLCILYEVWDKKYYKYYLFISGIERPLIEEDWPYDYLDGFPYNKVDFIPLPNEHYGLGLIAWMEDQQLELNRVRTSMYDHRRRFNRKYLVQEGQVEPMELNKLIYGDTGTIVKVLGPNAVIPLQEAKIPSDAYSIESTIKSDIMELTGVDQLARGGQLPSRTSAAEINARQSYVNLKLDDRVEDIDNFVLKNGRKTFQHIQANMTTDRIIQIAGPLGQIWVQISPDDIKGEFSITMDTVSAPKTDEVADRQQALQVYQLTLQNLPLLQQAQVPVNIGELYKWLMSKFNENDISKFLGGLYPNLQGGTNNVNPNTALNLQTGNTQNPPSAMTTSQLRNQLNGSQSGGGFNTNIPGIQ